MVRNLQIYRGYCWYCVESEQNILKTRFDIYLVAYAFVCYDPVSQSNSVILSFYEH